MAITRINRFTAAPGQVAALRERLASIVDAVAASPGCITVRVLHSLDDEHRFLVYEEWESVAAHLAAAAVIPPEMVASTVQLLTGPPEGEYLAPLA